MSEELRFPDFLIIGAMKAGTTTLYRDLTTHSRVFFPADKEPSNLCSPDSTTAKGRVAYAANYGKALPDHVCGDASTCYAKIPIYLGVPQRAKVLLPEHAKIIMSVREPVSRIVSQYRHEVYAHQIEDIGIDRAIERYPHLLDFSRYAMQIEPWIDTFGRQPVLIVEFEEYVSNRLIYAEKVQRFLGLEPECENIDASLRHNKREDARIATGLWRKIILGRVYRKAIRPLIPASVKAHLRRSILPPPSAESIIPSQETQQFIKDALRDDQAKLAQIMCNTDEN